MVAASRRDRAFGMLGAHNTLPCCGVLKAYSGNTSQTRPRTDPRNWSRVSVRTHSRAIRESCPCHTAVAARLEISTQSTTLSHIDPKRLVSTSAQPCRPLSESSWMVTPGGCAILGPRTGNLKPCQVACLVIPSWSSPESMHRASRWSGARLFVRSAGDPRCSPVGAGS